MTENQKGKKKKKTTFSYQASNYVKTDYFDLHLEVSSFDNDKYMDEN